LLLVENGVPMKTTNRNVLFDFQQKTPTWQNVDDGVMGGLSASRFAAQDGSLIFTGNVSLEHNGGFASAYLLGEQFDLSTYTGVCARVRGDGKRYGFTLVTPVSGQEQIHRAYFVAQIGLWQEVYMPFSGFVPMRRGRVLSSDIRPNLERVLKMGFIIADEQAGRFALQVEKISAYLET